LDEEACLQSKPIINSYKLSKKRVPIHKRKPEPEDYDDFLYNKRK
jgi:hypothetical protein